MTSAQADPQYDILIRNAQLLNMPGRKMSIAVADGRIAALAETIDGKAITEIDARGMLVSESFVNPHLHLCKVFTLRMMDDEALKNYHGADMGKAMTAIELAARVKEKYDQSWILPNVRKAVAQAAIYGCTHIRAFADVDSKARLEGVKALLQVRDEFKGVVDVQVVAFAQDGILREPEAAGLMHQALAMGADVVGGIPWIEYSDADILEHVRVIFDLAVEFNKDVSMLVDDAGDAGLRSLEAMALEAIRRGWHGRALAHHARAMALYPIPYFQKVAALLNKAQMGVVSDPHTGPLHARVRELLANGNLVCLGQDDISDAYYPFGRNNMLEVAFLGSHLLWFTSMQDIHTLYDMVTVKAARCIGLKDFEIRVGAPANLVVLDQPDVLEALRFHQAPLYTISHGRLIDTGRYRSLAFD
ncbi:MAG TPA: amidohydrolase family protein [Anaerolineales bacterium]|nr:amidohydrolase family protein [Anaerolineales bacterium]